MATPNCKCKVCGKEYNFCLKCNHKTGTPAPKWKVNFCDENCKKIFDLCVDFNFENITREEAEKQLGSLDTSKFSEFSDSVKTTIKAIQKKAPKSSEKKDDLKKEEPSPEESKGLMAPEEIEE